LVFAVDSDDSNIGAYRAQASEDAWVLEFGTWMPMVHKLNAAYKALAFNSGFPYVAFMGDDHVPRTPGWARTYVAELRRAGTGIVYGNDLVQGERLPTQWAMTSNIPRVLGRLVPADVEHMYCDNSILELGRASGCIKYLPDVIVEHCHPVAGRGDWDEGYEAVNSRTQYAKDHAAYGVWLMGQMATDVESVGGLIFREKIKTVATVSALTRDRVKDGRRPNGERCKVTVDQLGNTLTESSNRQDVLIRAPRVEARVTQREVRNGE
jgi:hypothetical protein